MALTHQQALAYQKRWKLLSQHDQNDLKRQTYTEKLDTLTMLYRSALELGWDETLEKEDAQVWQTWQRLRNRICGKNQ